MTTFRFNPRAPERHPGLGREYLPDLHAPPTEKEALMWTEGARDALRYAADLARKALAAGQSPEDLVARIENSTALPFTHTRYGHTFETAVIVERSGGEPCWLAWTIGPRETT